MGGLELTLVNATDGKANIRIRRTVDINTRILSVRVSYSISGTTDAIGRKVLSPNDVDLIRSDPVDGTVVEIDGLMDGIASFIKVVAVMAGSSPLSNDIALEVTSVATLGAPVLAFVGAISQTSLRVTLKPPTHSRPIDGYELVATERDSNQIKTYIFNPVSSDLNAEGEYTFDLTGLETMSEYEVVAAGYDDEGFGRDSNLIVGIPRNTTSAPTIVSTSGSDSNIHVDFLMPGNSADFNIVGGKISLEADPNNNLPAREIFYKLVEMMMDGENRLMYQVVADDSQVTGDGFYVDNGVEMELNITGYNFRTEYFTLDIKNINGYGTSSAQTSATPFKQPNQVTNIRVSAFDYATTSIISGSDLEFTNVTINMDEPSSFYDREIFGVKGEFEVTIDSLDIRKAGLSLAKSVYKRTNPTTTETSDAIYTNLADYLDNYSSSATWNSASKTGITASYVAAVDSYWQLYDAQVSILTAFNSGDSFLVRDWKEDHPSDALPTLPIRISFSSGQVSAKLGSTKTFPSFAAGSTVGITITPRVIARNGDTVTSQSNSADFTVAEKGPTNTGIIPSSVTLTTSNADIYAIIDEPYRSQGWGNVTYHMHLERVSVGGSLLGEPQDSDYLPSNNLFGVPDKVTLSLHNFFTLNVGNYYRFSLNVSATGADDIVCTNPSITTVASDIQVISKPSALKSINSDPGNDKLDMYYHLDTTPIYLNYGAFTTVEGIYAPSTILSSTATQTEINAAFDEYHANGVSSGFTYFSSNNTTPNGGSLYTSDVKYTIAGLENGISYTVAARVKTANSTPSDSLIIGGTLTTTPRTTPTAPTSLNMNTTQGSGEIDITYSPPDNNGFNDDSGADIIYEIQLLSGGSVVKTYNNGSATSLKILQSDLIMGTSYTFKITSKNTVSNFTSALASFGGSVTPTLLIDLQSVQITQNQKELLISIGLNGAAPASIIIMLQLSGETTSRSVVFIWSTVPYSSVLTVNETLLNSLDPEGFSFAEDEVISRGFVFAVDATNTVQYKHFD